MRGLSSLNEINNRHDGGSAENHLLHQKAVKATKAPIEARSEPVIAVMAPALIVSSVSVSVCSLCLLVSARVVESF